MSMSSKISTSLPTKCVDGKIDDGDIAIGCFTNSFGISGLIKFLSFSGETGHLSQIAYIKVGISRVVYKVCVWHLTSPIRCKLEGVSTPEKASEFTGMEVFVERTFATKLTKEEYYYADMYNLQVLINGEVRGKIVGIFPNAYAPLFEIDLQNNEKRYIPFIKFFFELPNLKNKTITLIKPELIE